MPTLANGIDTGLVKQFNAAVEILSQQKGSRLRNSVRLKTGVVGEETYINQIGKTTARKRTTRHADTPIVNTEWGRRKIAMIDYDWGDYLDTADKLKMLADPASEYVLNASYAIGRSMDIEIVAKAFAASNTGKAGGTSTSFPTSTNVVAVAASGLNVEKLLQAKEILDNNDIDDDEPRFIAITGKQLGDLLRETDVKSSDYNTVKALVKGEVDTFVGFKFIRISNTILATDSDDYRRCICWAKNGLGLAIAKDIMTDVSVDITKNMSTLVQAHLSIGSSRLDEDKVVEIKCSEA